MIELKAFEVSGKALFGRFYTKKVYDKDEVDKVIAGLNDEIHNLKRALINARHEVAKARGKKSSTKKIHSEIFNEAEAK